MMDRSELIRYANDSLLDEFQQRLNIQIRHIEIQVAMLKKELVGLETELTHLRKFFPVEKAPEAPPKAPQLKSNSGETPIPSFLTQPLQGTS
jgi:hypothetical protein